MREVSRAARAVLYAAKVAEHVCNLLEDVHADVGYAVAHLAMLSYQVLASSCLLDSETEH